MIYWSIWGSRNNYGEGNSEPLSDMCNSMKLLYDFVEAGADVGIKSSGGEKKSIIIY